MQMVIKFLRRLKEGHQQFLDFNKLEIIGKKLVHARVQPQIPNGNSVRDIIIRGKKNRNHYLGYSSKTLRLFAISFYEVIVDSYNPELIIQLLINSHSAILHWNLMVL